MVAQPLAPRLPERLKKEWTAEDAARELIRGRVEVLGPVTAQQLAASLATGSCAAARDDGRRVQSALLALETEGRVLRGYFTPRPQAEPAADDDFTRLEWCDRRLLARIHRYTISRLRAEIEPVTSADFMVIVVISSAIPFLNTGRMRGIVIFDGKRNQSAPQIPTSAEAGMPQLTAVNWYALLAPAGTPRPIIERLNVESVRVMNTPETRASLAAMGGTPDGKSPEEAADFMRAEYARWGKVIREANIKVE